MPRGKIKRIANTEQKFGANAEYLFLKVQADWDADAEEYLLLTDHEYDEALERSGKNPEDLPRLSRGEFTRVDNTQRKFGADSYYVAIRVKPEGGGKWATLLFTEEGLDRIRERVQKNAEDIEANRESWLADLFD